MSPVYAVGVVLDGTHATVWTSGHHTWKQDGIRSMIRRAANAAVREAGGERCYAAPATLDEREATASRLSKSFEEIGYTISRRYLDTRRDPNESIMRAHYRREEEI